MKKLFQVLAFIFISQTFFAQTPDTSSNDVLLKLNLKRRFELSFGQNILFIPYSKLVNIREDEALIVPTGSILLFSQLRPDHRLRIPLFCNIPTETKQFLVNGQLISERASTAFGTGLEWRVFRIILNEKSRVEFEAGPLMSVLFDKGNRVRYSPLVAGRFRLQQNTNFIMFIGTSYSFGINVNGLFFGTGIIF